MILEISCKDKFNVMLRNIMEGEFEKSVFGFEVWRYSSDANVISTPVVANDMVIFGNQNGDISGISIKDGTKKWEFKTKGSIFSSPASLNGKVVFGSADGNIYCLNSKTGKLIWKTKTGAAVLASPLISDEDVFIGGSDHTFRKLNLNTGKTIWSFTELGGLVINGTDIYVGGTIPNALSGYFVATYWKNGTSVSLTDGTTDAVVRDMFVFNSDVYATGLTGRAGWDWSLACPISGWWRSSCCRS